MQPIILILSLFSLLSNSVASTEGNDDRRFNRIFQTAKDKHNVTVTNPFNYVDPNHTKGISHGFFTQEDFEENDQDGIDFYMNYYGINVTEGIYFPAYTGYYNPIYQSYYVPVDIGTDDFAEYVVDDSKYNSRVVESVWFRSFSGTIVFFNKTGTFPSGLHASKIFYQRDSLIHGFMSVLRYGADWSKKQNHEDWRCASYGTGRTYLNMDSQEESVIKWQCYSLKDNTPFICLITTTYEKELDGITTDETKRMTCTSMPPNEVV